MIRLRRKVKLSRGEATALSVMLYDTKCRLRLLEGYQGWRYDERDLQRLEDLLDMKLWGKLYRH